jgi:hypothetical protein
MRTRFLSLIGLSAALFVGQAPRAGAQRVHGSIRDSASAAPLAGAVVSLLDSAGGALSRTIADGNGNYSLPLARRGARLRAIRIGYQPRDVSVASTGADVTLSLSLTRIPPVLGPVRVSDKELCPGSSDRGAAFQLWEQARAGLLATVVAREATPAQATTLVFERGFAPNDATVHRQRTSQHEGRTTKAFVAAAAPVAFARRGYVTEDPDGGRTYAAPDEDVLLDESFAATHCFHLQAADDTHRDQVGLAFTPVRGGGRDTLVDVSGVIWIDRAAPALRTLDFRYTGLEPAAERAETGGHMEFRAMSNGVAFIEYWSLRLPLMQQFQLGNTAAQRTAPRVSPHRRDRFDLRVSEIVETGGQVLGAVWDDGTRWAAPSTGIQGTVTQRGTGAPVPHAVVRLQGTTDSTTASVTGAYMLAPLVAGRYILEVSDTALQAWIAPRTSSATVDAPRGRIVTSRVELPTRATVVSEICKTQQRRPAVGTTIVGVVEPTTAGPMRNARVNASWAEHVGFGSATMSVQIQTRDQTSDVDANGRFMLCGVPVEQAIRLRFQQGDRTADTTVVLRDTISASVRWRIP